MKVLNIINELALDGGAENLVKDLVLKMNQKGIKSDITILKGKDSPAVQELINNDIGVFYSGCDNIYSPSQILRIMKNIQEYDIVHTHLFPSQYWYIFSKLIKRSSVKSVTTEHSTSNRRRNNSFYRFPEKFIYNKYDKVVCISKGTEEKLLEWVPSIRAKTITIYNGIDIEKFRNCRPYEREQLVPGLKPDSKLVLMVARMSMQKDYETLINAVHLLPTDYHAILVGEGPQMSKLKKRTEDLDIAERIHFLGVRNDVNRIMKSVDLFVLSSNWEGFGLAAVEAMASGLPVVASNVSGLADIVNGYGILFSKGDFEELANIIQDIFLKEGTYEEVAEKCRKRAMDFSIDKVADDYIEMYKGLLEM